MKRENKIFFAIVLGAVIIGAFVYFGLKNLPLQVKAGPSVFLAPKTETKTSVKDSPKNISQNSTPTKTNSVSVCGAAENSIVTKVIDGDTVVVEGGWHVRLLGMDADERGYPCYDAAKTRLEDLVLNKTVQLEKDQTDTDQYGRCLRYIFLGATNIDEQLVQEGLAVARFYAPDLKYKPEISAAEQQAIAGKIGCKWSGSSQTAK